MPQIPILQQRTLASQAGLGPGPSADPGMQALGQAIGDVGNDLVRQQQAAILKDEQDASVAANDELMQARREWLTELRRRRDTAAPGAPNFAGQVDEDFKQGIADRVGRIRTSREKQRLKQQLDDLHFDVVQDAMDFEGRARAADRGAKLGSALDAGLTAVQMRPDDAQTVLDEQLSAISTAGLSPEARAKFEINARAGIAEAAATGLAERDPAAARKSLATDQSGDWRFDSLTPEARERVARVVSEASADSVVGMVMDQYRTNYRLGADALSAVMADESLPADDKARIAGRVREQTNLLTEERRQQNVDGLTQLAKFQARGDPSTERLAGNLYDKGALSEAQYAGAIEAAERAKIAANKADEEQSIIAAKLAAGEGFDPTDTKAREAISGYFKRQLAGVAPGSAQYVQAAVALTQHTNIAPDAAVDWARTSMMGQNPDTVAAGADLIAQLQDANPRASLWTLDERTRSMAADIADAVRAGTPAADAVEMARKNYDRSTAEKKAYEQAYTASKAPKENGKALSRFIGASPKKGGFDPGIFSSAPDAPPGMQADFSDAVQRYFPLTGGNLEVSRARAFADLKRKWGVTTVNGQPEFTPYAPEAMFPGLTAEVVRADVEATLRTDRPDGADIPAGTDLSGVRLVGVPATAASSGVQWELQMLDEFGAPSPVLDKQGRPFRYSLPVKQSSYYQARRALYEERAVKPAQENRQNVKEAETLRGKRERVRVDIEAANRQFMW